ERLHGMQEVSGSIPLSSTTLQTLASAGVFVFLILRYAFSLHVLHILIIFISFCSHSLTACLNRDDAHCYNLRWINIDHTISLTYFTSQIKKQNI
uniref:hypothetical protein n=1 Tax=Atlantibacter sp. TaxID=1903473 RepID=UPI0028A09248